MSSKVSPNFMHYLGCACTSTYDVNPCHVRLHYACGPGKIYRFNTIQDAYKFAHDAAIDFVTIPTLINEDGKPIRDYPSQYLYNNGQFVCELDWHTYQCEILSDLNRNVPYNHVWNICAGDEIQVSLGLGYMMVG